MEDLGVQEKEKSTKCVIQRDIKVTFWYFSMHIAEPPGRKISHQPNAGKI